MKRSEMLEKLLNLSEIGSIEAADYILLTLEKEGMLPPCDNSCKPENYPEGTLYQGCNYEWEQEDE